MRIVNRYWSITRKANIIRVAVASAVSAWVVGSVIAGPGSGGQWFSGSAVSPVCEPDPTRGSQQNALAANASGLTIASWEAFTYANGGGGSIGVAVESDGKWEPAFVISGSSAFAFSPRVAAGADGTLAVSWTEEDRATSSAPQRRINVSVRPGDLAWTTTTLASGPVGGVARANFSPVKVDPSGNVTACWTLWNGSSYVLQAASKPAGSSWSTPLSLAPDLDSYDVSLAINANGDAAIAFTTSPYSSYVTGTAAYCVFRSGAAGSWTPPVTVSEAMPNTQGYITKPQVALDAAGLATVMYLGNGVEAVRQLADGSWTFPRTVLQGQNQSSSLLSPELGMDQNGNAVAGVSVFDATPNVDRASVWVTIGTPDGNWTPQVRLTDPEANVDAYATQVAVSPDGTLVLVGWIDHYHADVQVSQLNAGVWGVPETIGRGTAASGFQEMLSLDAPSAALARAVWKNAKTGTRTMAASYGIR